ncbi:hypothetical protein Vadar_011543 [Vaccinium darrowii]|uniref:Uncharacterized protein n=1 Tax=Vaccinium darrowii TaxID=229202 RepID=A0ACB7YM15_9ERIC|nr:hypothetical protein Vadar_011543 [Vaccinium darrowii]
MATTSAPTAFFVCFLITTATFHVCFCNNNNITCFENEREALLKFKQDLKDPSNRLSSWDTVEDCCRWAGVVCDNLTGHVHEIRLQNPWKERYYGTEAEYQVSWRNQLQGKVNPSLLDMMHLQYLDLSGNNFEGTPVPSFIGSIATLRYLNLSRAGFSGIIPPQLGNVTAMRYLDLGDNDVLPGGNLQWLSGLVSLQHLNMSGVNLSTALDWVQVTSNLHSLVELHLSGCELKYVVSSSLTNKSNFTTLNILDLSNNDLGSSIPGWLPGLNNLLSLDLSFCSFSSPIPSGLQNMTSLQVLDLSFNYFNSTIPDWLYSLTHLESLSLRFNHLQGGISIAIENLTSLVSLDLSINQLQGSIPTSLGKLCKLKTIYLSDNGFSGEVSDVLIGFSRCMCPMLEDFDFGLNNLLGHLPDEFGQLKNLNSFDIMRNSFSGPIPVSIGRLSSLKELYLSYNKFNGTIPETIGRLSSLKWLCLSYNKFNQTIPESFWQLAKLETLVLTDNTLEGVVSDVHFASLTRLRYLLAGGNNLTFKASENWVPPFQVEELDLSSWQLGPLFPLWLSSQRKLTYLNIANTRISGSIPTLFWPIFSKLSYANLSRNHFSGEIPSLSKEPDSLIDLSSNILNGLLPLVPSNLTWLDLSNNSFSGSIHHVLCGKGEEPNKTLSFLNLGKNLLSGNIPECWKHWPDLNIIKMENNNLVGGIPSSIGQLPYLRSLHLRHNNLSGELPPTLQNCSSLRILDLSENIFTGSIPPWMGNALLDLVVLNLRSNNFWGDLPYELCHLSSLQILDIAYNNILGHVPRCFANFSAMAEMPKINGYLKDMLSYRSVRTYYTVSDWNFRDNAFLVAKGREVEYSTTLELVKSMDLSGNKLSGEIPEELTKLVGLWSLNLSCNHLTGRIPRNIGDMRQLESVDFSLNQLSGVIPSSMSSLSFLSHLNLSYNNLTGPIPSSTQLQSMTESSFLGNKLCGPPLPSCKLNKTIPPNVVPHGSDEEGEGFSEALFFASIALGFAVGFWVVLGPLLFKRSWRIVYFQVIEDIWNKVCDFSFECRYMKGSKVEAANAVQAVLIVGILHLWV